MPLSLTDAFLTLAARDFVSLVQFYRLLLNQAPITLIPDVYAEFLLPGLRLGIFHPKKFEVKEFAQADPRHGMSLCLEVADLEAAIAHLTDLGHPPPGEIITASHGREIYGFDPEGNWLILHQSI